MEEKGDANTTMSIGALELQFISWNLRCICVYLRPSAVKNSAPQVCVGYSFADAMAVRMSSSRSFDSFCCSRSGAAWARKAAIVVATVF